MASREGSLGGNAAIRNMIYNTFMRRTSVFTATCVLAGMVTTNYYLKATDGVWKSLNKGVSIYFYIFLYLSSNISIYLFLFLCM